MVIQHLNTACRVARQFPEMPVARLILQMNDSDVLFQRYEPNFKFRIQVSNFTRMTWQWMYKMYTSIYFPIQDVITRSMCLLIINGCVIAMHYVANYVDRIVVVVAVFLVTGFIAVFVLRKHLYNWFVRPYLNRRKEIDRENRRNKVITHNHYSLKSERFQKLNEFGKVYKLKSDQKVVNKPSAKNSGNANIKENNYVEGLESVASFNAAQGSSRMSSAGEFVHVVVVGVCSRWLTCFRTRDAVVVDFSQSDDSSSEGSDNEANGQVVKNTKGNRNGVVKVDETKEQSAVNKQVNARSVALEDDDDFDIDDDTTTTQNELIQNDNGSDDHFEEFCVPSQSFHQVSLTGPPIPGAPMASYVSVHDKFGNQNSLRSSKDALQIVDLENSTITDTYGSIKEWSLLDRGSQMNKSIQNSEEKQSEEEIEKKSVLGEDEQSKAGSTNSHFQEDEEDFDTFLAREEEKMSTGAYSGELSAQPERELLPTDFLNEKIESVVMFKVLKAQQVARDKKLKLRGSLPVMCMSDDFDFYDYNDLANCVAMKSSSRRNNRPLRRRPMVTNKEGNIQALDHMIYSFEPSLNITEDNFRRFNEKKHRAKKLRLREFSATGPGYRIPIQELNVLKSPYTMLGQYMIFTEDCELSVGDIVISGIDEIERKGLKSDVGKVPLTGMTTAIVFDGKFIMNRMSMQGAKKPKLKKIDTEVGNENTATTSADTFPSDVEMKDLNHKTNQKVGHNPLPPPPPNVGDSQNSLTNNENLGNENVSVNSHMKNSTASVDGEITSTANPGGEGKTATMIENTPHIPYIGLSHSSIESIGEFVYTKSTHKLWVEEPKKD